MMLPVFFALGVPFGRIMLSIVHDRGRRLLGGMTLRPVPVRSTEAARPRRSVSDPRL